MRPLDLDQISDEAMSLSQVIVLDDPAQSFKATLLQLADFLEARFLERQFPVGSTLYRVDNRTPMELGFPGTWTRYAEGLSLATGRADGTDTGTTAGSNSVAVPVPQHSHTASATQSAHSHSVTATADEHTHAYQGASGSTREHCSDGCSEGSLVNMSTKTTDAASSNVTVTLADATPSISVAVANAGTAGASMDVEGAHINGVLWQRTA